MSHKPRFDAADLRSFCASLASPTAAQRELVGITATKKVKFINLVRLICERRLAAWFGSSMTVGFDNLFVAKDAPEKVRLDPMPTARL